MMKPPRTCTRCRRPLTERSPRGSACVHVRVSGEEFTSAWSALEESRTRDAAAAAIARLARMLAR
jgi:hypothetical protein